MPFLKCPIAALIITLSALTDICVAQRQLKPTDIAKIEFVTRGHATSKFYERFTVKNYGGEWKSYRTFYRTEDDTLPANTDSLFRATLNERDINILLDKISGDVNMKDSIHLPRLSKKQLAQYIDTLAKRHQMNITLGQRAKYIKAGSSNSFYERVSQRAIHGLVTAGPNLFISVITKSNDTISLSGRYAGIYHTPWRINNRADYGQTIGTIFNKAVGNNGDIGQRQYERQIDFGLFLMMSNDRLASQTVKATN